MDEIRELTADEHETFARIAARAYPAMRLPQEGDVSLVVDRMRRRLDPPRDTLWGCFRDGALIGGMRLIRFEMNMRGAMVGAGGVGQVAVDLLHKKQGVAKALIFHFLSWCRANGMPLATLYPFRPDFYAQMGFGPGTRQSQYRFAPAALPARETSDTLRYLTPADAPAIGATYARVQRETHGMMARLPHELDNLFQPAVTWVGAFEGDTLRGYLSYGLETDLNNNFVRNDLHLRELIYETPAALTSLLAFLRVQADQFNRIIFETQDDDFAFLLSDPRDDSNRLIPSVYHQSNTQGVGIMYRILDLPPLFAALSGARFGPGRLTLRLVVEDDFQPGGLAPLTVRFAEGQATLAPSDRPDAEVSFDVASCSSLLMGSVSALSLWRYGKLAISDPALIETVEAIFSTSRKPVCMTHF
jgi:predicted acetyltransferase